MLRKEVPSDWLSLFLTFLALPAGSGQAAASPEAGLLALPLPDGTSGEGPAKTVAILYDPIISFKGAFLYREYVQNQREILSQLFLHFKKKKKKKACF